jgi:hypothetical protein
MPDQNTPDAKPDNPDHNPSIESKPIQSLADKERQTEPKDASTNAEEDDARKFKEDVRSGEKWLIGIGVASVLVNLIIAYFYFGQLTEMRVATEASTKAASLASDALELNSGDFERTMRQLRYQTKAQVDSANAAKDTSKTAVDSIKKSRDAFRDDQRAWLGMVGEHVSQFERGKPIGITVEFFNSGRTPARKVYVHTMMTLSAKPLTGPGTMQKLKLASAVFQPVESVAPQGHYEMVIGKPFAVGQVISEEESATVKLAISHFDDIQSMKQIVYFYGELSYEDVSDRSHLTQFCVFISDPDSKSVGICPEFNELY